MKTWLRPLGVYVLGVATVPALLLIGTVTSNKLWSRPHVPMFVDASLSKGVIVKCCGRGCESGGDFGEDDTVLELGVFGDFDEVPCGVERSPVLRGGLGEFEEHRERGLAGAVAFGAAMT